MPDDGFSDGDENIGMYGPWFQQFLRERRVGLHPGCPFSVALHDLARLRAGIKTRVPLQVRFPKQKQRERFLTGALGADLFTTLLHGVADKVEAPFADHWRHFRSADAIPTRVGANTTSNNKLWELFVGAAVARFANDLRVEEPDVTCTFGDARWGIACKTFHGNEPQTHLKRLVEGAKQIEKSGVQHGVVVVNLANLVPQSMFFRVREDWGDATEVLRSVEALGRGILNAIPQEELARRLSVGPNGPRDCTRAVVAFCPVLVPRFRQATLQCMTLLHEFRRIQHTLEWEFVFAFREALRKTMSERSDAEQLAPANDLRS